MKKPSAANCRPDNIIYGIEAKNISVFRKKFFEIFLSFVGDPCGIPGYGQNVSPTPGLARAGDEI